MNKRKPNFTQVPNEFLDDCNLTNAEFRILMIISRQTFGWHKDKDKISLSQFMQKTGMSKNTIIKAIRNLEKKEFIEKETHRTANKINSISEYSIKGSSEIEQGVVQKLNNFTQIGSSEIELGVVQKLNTQKKNINKPNLNKNINKGGTASTFLVKYYNKKSGRNIKLTSTRSSKLKSTLKDYTVRELVYSINGLLIDKWSIENNQLGLERIIEAGKRDNNIEKFGSFRFRKKFKKIREVAIVKQIPLPVKENW